MTATTPKPTLRERLDVGPVICAEGYVFELERRGYLQAGAFVPEVVLEHPEAVTQLHRDFVHAGSDVVEALTYYAHREKLRLIGREQDLEPINRRALDLAKAVARESGAFFAGDICNTNVYDPADRASHKAVRAMFEEQVGWAADAGVDFIIGETFSYAEEALIALDVIKQANQAAVITLAMHQANVTRGMRVAAGRKCVRFRAQGVNDHHSFVSDDDAAAEGDPRGDQGADGRAAGPVSDARRPTVISVAAR